MCVGSCACHQVCWEGQFVVDAIARSVDMGRRIGGKLRFGLVYPLIFALTFVLAGFGQSTAEQDSSTGKESTEQKNDNNRPGKQIGEGGEDIGNGVGKGSADLGRGLAGGVGELATGHGVGAATSVGKGTVGFGKNV